MRRVRWLSTLSNLYIRRDGWQGAQWPGQTEHQDKCHVFIGLFWTRGTHCLEREPGLSFSLEMKTRTEQRHTGPAFTIHCRGLPPSLPQL